MKALKPASFSNMHESWERGKIMFCMVILNVFVVTVYTIHLLMILYNLYSSTWSNYSPYNMEIIISWISSGFQSDSEESQYFALIFPIWKLTLN